MGLFDDGASGKRNKTRPKRNQVVSFVNAYVEKFEGNEYTMKFKFMHSWWAQRCVVGAGYVNKKYLGEGVSDTASCRFDSCAENNLRQ